MSILLALMFPAAIPVTSDVAGNRMVPLAPVASVEFAAKEGERTEPLCTTKRDLCVQAVSEGKTGNWRVRLYAGLPGSESLASYGVKVDGQLELWPRVVMSPGGRMLVGTILSQSTGYSGGGASSSRLSLTEIVPGEMQYHELLNMPWSGTATIRACFGERERRVRGGACQDEYAFSAALSLDPATRTGRPRLRMTTVAKTFPGKLSRQADNSGKRLTKKDIVWWRDPVCSYTRLFAWSSATRGYAPDRALPGCADYLEM